MGKRKIGEIYNKPIIEGDINLKTPNEIHKSELSGGADVQHLQSIYLAFKQPIKDLEIPQTLSSLTMLVTFRLCVASTYKTSDNLILVSAGLAMSDWEGFELHRIEVIPNTKEDILFTGVKMPIFTNWNSFLEYLDSLGDEFVSLFTSTFEEITEEEFYRGVTTAV